MVTDKCGPELINDLFMLHANSLDEALNKAYNLSGRNARVTVIPDGVSVVVEQ
jgi:nickel-dependent lactate racemase